MTTVIVVTGGIIEILNKEMYMSDLYRYERQCPFCGRKCVIGLDDAQVRKLKEYQRGGSYIQELFSEFNPVEREFIKSGFCPECQENIFGNGETGRIKWSK